MVSDDTGTCGVVTTLDEAGVDAVALGTSVVAGGTVSEPDGGASASQAGVSKVPGSNQMTRGSV